MQFIDDTVQIREYTVWKKGAGEVVEMALYGGKDELKINYMSHIKVSKDRMLKTKDTLE